MDGRKKHQRITLFEKEIFHLTNCPYYGNIQMENTMGREKIYLTAEVTRMLGITKKTLYRWEAQRKIPKAKRDLISNYRIYTIRDIERIKKLTRRK